MKIKVIKCEHSCVQPGMEGEAEPQGRGCFATFKDVPNPVPGYSLRGDITTFLQEGEFVVLPDPVEEKLKIPQLQTLENKVNDPIGVLIQLMRVCRMDQIRKRLEIELKKYPEDFYVIAEFYRMAAEE